MAIERPAVCILALLALAGAAQAAPPVSFVGMRIGPIDSEKLEVALVMAPSAVGNCAGQFRGNLSFFNAAPGASIAGNFVERAGGCELAGPIPWAALSIDAVQQARGEAVHVRFRGERIEGRKVRKVDWGSSIPRAAVQLAEPMKLTLHRFAAAQDMSLGPLGLNTTTLNAEVVVRSPLRFHLRVMEARCELEIDGQVVASGRKENFLIFGGRPNPVTFPVTVNYRALLSSAGSTLSKGGRVEGRLAGVARLRFPGGDIDFPVEVPIRLSLK